MKTWMSIPNTLFIKIGNHILLTSDLICKAGEDSLFKSLSSVRNQKHMSPIKKNKKIKVIHSNSFD